jgi:hypothetical protein
VWFEQTEISPSSITDLSQLFCCNVAPLLCMSQSARGVLNPDVSFVTVSDDRMTNPLVAVCAQGVPGDVPADFGDTTPVD